MNQDNPAPTYLFVFRGPDGQCVRTPEEMQQTFQKWMTWIAGMKARGQYLGGAPLEEKLGAVLRGPGGGHVTDGPFAEAKEVVAGYMLIAAKTFGEAVEISKGCPGYEVGGSVEVRQIMPVPM
jgi:hypothetical protein